MRRTSRDLTDGSIVRSIWHLALPMMAGNLLQDTFTIVDMIFVGKLGPSAIAAVGMSGTIQGMLFTFIFGISMGTVAMVSRAIGAKNLPGAENVAMQSIILGLICYVGIAVIGYLSSAFALEILGAESDVVSQGTTYMKVSFVGSITMILSVILSAILNASGDAMTPLKTLVVATISNIILDPLLIFGLWIFPRLGVVGSALATVLSRGISVSILFFVLLKGSSIIHLKVRHVKIDFSLMWRIMKIGVFSSIQAVVRNASALILTRIVATYGTFAVAAYVIGMRLRMIVLMPGFGLADATSTLVGQNLGAGKPKRAERTTWITVGIASAIMAFVGVIYIIFAKSVISIFNSHPEVVKIGVTQLYVLAGAFGIVAVSIVIGRAFNGAGDTLSPMIIACSTLLPIQIGLSLLLSREFGIIGIWFGIVSTDIIQGIMMSLWFNTGRWRHKKV